jgi:hypothetical protein
MSVSTDNLFPVLCVFVASTVESWTLRIMWITTSVKVDKRRVGRGNLDCCSLNGSEGARKFTNARNKDRTASLSLPQELDCRTVAGRNHNLQCDSERLVKFLDCLHILLFFT